MSADPYRLLVVANRTCPCPGLPDAVRGHARGRDVRVHVVAPALTSRLRYWVSDVDGGIAAAKERLADAVAALKAAGLGASGEVGDADPMLAIEDALPAFPADAVLISTWPQGRSNWLERNLVERARHALEIDVHHVTSRYDLPALSAA